MSPHRCPSVSPEWGWSQGCSDLTRSAPQGDWVWLKKFPGDQHTEVKPATKLAFCKVRGSQGHRWVMGDSTGSWRQRWVMGTTLGHGGQRWVMGDNVGPQEAVGLNTRSWWDNVKPWRDNSGP